ncbi:MAG: DUF58 domain-containing protein [Anaerolineae bacterium]|nr:DUF58 domain-containing protein [Anaerolineae bacterium]
MSRVMLPGFLAFALVLVGLGTRQGDLIALAVPFVMYMAAALLFAPAPPVIAATRHLSRDRIQAGDTVEVQIEVTNRGPALEEVHIADLLPDGLQVVHGTTSVAAPLEHGQRLIFSYTATARRGIYQFEAVDVAAVDPLGLLPRHVQVAAPDQLVALPAVRRISAPAIRPLRTRGYAGPVPSRQGGSGVDFFGVREYQMGDPRRAINWRVSARHAHTLFSNEFERERIADVGLILDARQRSEVRSGEASLFEYAVHATASLADAFLSEGNRVGLLIYGGALHWTIPGYGKLQREHLLRALAGAHIGESQVFDRLNYLPTRFFAAQSQLILVSPFWPDDIAAVRRLLARGYRVLVVRPDPVLFERQSLPDLAEVDLAVRIIGIERALTRRRLQRLGVRVVDWNVSLPLDRAIRTSLGRMPPVVHAGILG